MAPTRSSSLRTTMLPAERQIPLMHSNNKYQEDKTQISGFTSSSGTRKNRVRGPGVVAQVPMSVGGAWSTQAILLSTPCKCTSSRRRNPRKNVNLAKFQKACLVCAPGLSPSKAECLLAQADARKLAVSSV
ncbi:hypothetical protein LIA77_02634 [Sarocladium implicatum]|nr:hypothetical protein LIA77_02634 [Sarocladium implicatum]